MEINNSLEKLGFSSQETAVYLALLRVGESPVGSIINTTGFHREIVYSCLKRLEQQGYIQSIEKKKIRHFQALNPSIISQKIEEKARIAAKALPELKSLYSQPNVVIKVLEGKEGFEEIEIDWAKSLKDREDFFCIGGAGEAWYAITKDFYKSYHKKLLKRGIHLRTITFPNEIESIMQYENPKFNTIKSIPREFCPPSSTIIYSDKILLQVFGESPLAIMIQSKEISKAYKAYFDVLWSIAKPVNK